MIIIKKAHLADERCGAVAAGREAQVRELPRPPEVPHHQHLLVGGDGEGAARAVVLPGPPRRVRPQRRALVAHLACRVTTHVSLMVPLCNGVCAHKLCPNAAYCVTSCVSLMTPPCQLL